MNVYSNVTQQDLIFLRKLAEQQKNQRALKIKSRILKQTQDIKLAESLSPITKKLDEVKESTRKIGEIVKETNTSQPAIKNTHTALPIENEQRKPGIIYETSLENTLNSMKNNIGFFNIEERENDDIFWTGFPVEKIGGNKLKINENIFDITPGLQKVLTDTSNLPLKKLNDQDREIFINILESLNFEKYKAIRDESKSGRYKQHKINFEKRDLEGQEKNLLNHLI